MFYSKKYVVFKLVFNYGVLKTFWKGLIAVDTNTIAHSYIARKCSTSYKPGRSQHKFEIPPMCGSG